MLHKRDIDWNQIGGTLAFVAAFVSTVDFCIPQSSIELSLAFRRNLEQ